MAIEIDPAAAVQSLPELVNDDEALVRRGRFLSVDFMIEIGRTPYYISIRDGRIATLDSGPLLMRPWTFALRGDKNAWRTFWRRFPPPHWHDVFAMAKAGEMRIEGDIYPFMSNLLYFKALLSAPRRLSEAA